jgi:hypothetical protein
VEFFDGLLRFQADGAMPLGLVSEGRFLLQGVERLPADEGGPATAPGAAQWVEGPGSPAGFRTVASSFWTPGTSPLRAPRTPPRESRAPGDEPFAHLEVGTDGEPRGPHPEGVGVLPGLHRWDGDPVSGPVERMPRRQVIPDQVISDNSDFSVKPMKRALVLGLFDWEFTPQETSLVSRRIDNGREFKCQGCVDVRSNDFPRDGMRCRPEPDGQCLPIQTTSWRDFLGWEAFDLIHVGTHGSQHCRQDGTCLTMLATGRVGARGEFFEGAVRDADLRPLARYNLIRSHAGITRPGVEYLMTGPSSICKEPPAPLDRQIQRRVGGDDPHDHWVTDRSSKAYDLLCRNMLWEMVTDDFFRAAYPSGLRDKLIVLNACETFRSPHLVRHLAAGGSTTIFGWKVPIDANVGLRVMEHFYARLFPGFAAGGDAAADRGGGARAVVAWADAVRTHYRPLPPDSTDLARALRIPAPDSSEYVDKRPKELVYLLDPEAGREMPDGARLELVGTAGDGRSDSIRVTVEVHGLADEERLDEFRVGFRLDGSPLPTTYPLNQRLGEETWGFLGTVPLGRDARPGERVDLDVRAEIPGGGITRWLYEDLLLLGGCSFVGRIAEIRIPSPRERFLAAMGEYSGHAVSWDGSALTFRIRNREEGPRFGTPEVMELQMELRLARPPGSPEDGPLGPGRHPVGMGNLILTRDNPFHDPARTWRSTPVLDVNLLAGLQRPRDPGHVELYAGSRERLAGSMRVPLEIAGAQFLFEGEFDAGNLRTCGEGG